MRRPSSSDLLARDAGLVPAHLIRRLAARIAGDERGTPFFEAFTPAARKVMVAAEGEARALGHTSRGPEHLLLALHSQPAEPAAALLSELGASHEAMAAALVPLAPPTAGAPPDRVPFTAGSKEALVLARGAAVGLEDAQVGTGHLLLGLLRQPDSRPRAVLTALEINADDADAVLRQRMAAGS